MKNRKVAVISPSPIEQVNETFIKAHVDYIDNTTFLYGGKIPFTSETGESIIRFTFLSRMLHKVKSKLGLTNFSYNESEFYRFLKKNKFTSVLAEYGDVGAEVAPVVDKLGIDLLVHFHGADISLKSILDAYTPRYKAMFKIAKWVFSVSTPMKNKLIELGCDPNKVINNPCAPRDMFFENEPDYSKKTVVALGGFVDKKAPYITVHAFNLVLKKVPDAKLIFGGNGALFNTCIFLADYLGISDSIEFVGFVHPKDAQEHIAKGSIFVQHSVTGLSGDQEGTPVAIMEAMASGLPVVSTIHGGIPEVVTNDFNGFVVEEKDVEGMANALIKILSDENLKRELGSNARKRVKESYTMGQHIQKIQDAINS